MRGPMLDLLRLVIALYLANVCATAFRDQGWSVGLVALFMCIVWINVFAWMRHGRK
jgi:hypothetical protein